MSPPRVLTVLAACLFLAACSTPEPPPLEPARGVPQQAAPEPAEPAPEPEQAAPDRPNPESEPHTYGDDPTLDRLQDDCETGDTDACSELYWAAAVDSDYETVGRDGMEPVTADLGWEPLMTIAWTGMDSGDRTDICVALDYDNPQLDHALYVSFAEGLGDDPGFVGPSEDELVGWMRDACQDE